MGPEVIAQVLLRERVRLTSAAMAFVRDVHTADDVYQQIMLSVLQGRVTVKDPEHALAWALRAVRHRAYDLAKQNHLRPLPDTVLDALEVEWAEETEHEERLRALSRCVGKLADSARRLLSMKYDEGMPVADIAARLNRTREAVYQSLYRIHCALRGCVQVELGELASQPEGTK